MGFRKRKSPNGWASRLRRLKTRWRKACGFWRRRWMDAGRRSPDRPAAMISSKDRAMSAEQDEAMAAEWLAREDRGLTLEEQGALDAWLAQSGLNRVAY